MDSQEPKYDVALSFAGEQRAYVDAVASSLKEASVKVFYDDYEKVELWGKDLYAHLDWVYRKASRYCVIFVSADYAKKVWTNHERRSAQGRAIQENSEYLLPARFDETDLPGLPPTVGYLDLASLGPAELAANIREKLGPPRLEPGFPPKTDRLWSALSIKGDKSAKKQERKETQRVARSFYGAMQRMNMEERRAIAGILAFGCVGELPQGVHLSLSFLCRVTKMPQAELLDHLRAVRSLNLKVVVRDPIHRPDEGELQSDDRDLLLSFWSPDAPQRRDATKIAYYAVQCASHHFCVDHGVEVVARLDFRRLSKAFSGPLVIEADGHEIEDGGSNSPNIDLR
ncbi:toll/interleukin-1 receptor domain-containing protein [Kineococcus sp. TBRC 1896]|uniref:Toll/interleukin-1 receptor domain-containing protein n=1 Tax=Kineococcus mangrovi TaxID=1660183 RepID=A0ABV4I120_9ACTN